VSLDISTDLALTVDVAGEAIAILAKRGAGKTNTATVLVEELVAADIQTVVIDPVGAWWGIRSSAEGEHGAGLSVPILGGQHGDVPLEQTAGSLIADVVVDSGSSLLLDLSDFPSKSAVNRFVTDFAERLYRRKARANSLLHLVLEEADEFAPQRGSADTARMRGAIEQIVRRGRSRGLGVTLITQRSAVLNKDVLTQTDVLIVMRTTGPHDVRAIKEWVAAKGDEHGEEVISSLPSLATGEAWVWNPERDILRRARIRRRRTFDSSATPKAGERRQEPTERAEIDVQSLGEKIAATAEKAKAEDPRELRKRIRELEARLKDESKENVVERIEVPVEVPAVAPETLQHLQDSVGELRDVIEVAVSLRAVADQIEQAIRAVRALDVKNETLQPRRPRRDVTARPETRQPAEGSNGSFATSNAQQRILDALAALETIGVAEAQKVQLALFAQASPKSSGYSNNLGALRTAGMIDYPRGGFVALTDAGRSLADAGGAPDTVDELHEYVFSLVGGARTRILEVLISAYPEALHKNDLALAAEASPSSSGYSNNLGSLRSLGLIDYPRPGYVAALPVLFLDMADAA